MLRCRFDPLQHSTGNIERGTRWFRVPLPCSSAGRGLFLKRSRKTVWFSAVCGGAAGRRGRRWREGRRGWAANFPGGREPENGPRDFPAAARAPWSVSNGYLPPGVWPPSSSHANLAPQGWPTALFFNHVRGQVLGGEGVGSVGVEAGPITLYHWSKQG